MASPCTDLQRLWPQTSRSRSGSSLTYLRLRPLTPTLAPAPLLPLEAQNRIAHRPQRFGEWRRGLQKGRTKEGLGRERVGEGCFLSKHGGNPGDTHIPTRYSAVLEARLREEGSRVQGKLLPTAPCPAMAERPRLRPRLRDLGDRLVRVLGGLGGRRDRRNKEPPLPGEHRVPDRVSGHGTPLWNPAFPPTLIPKQALGRSELPRPGSEQQQQPQQQGIGTSYPLTTTTTTKQQLVAVGGRPRKRSRVQALPVGKVGLYLISGQGQVSQDPVTTSWLKAQAPQPRGDQPSSAKTGVRSSSEWDLLNWGPGRWPRRRSLGTSTHSLGRLQRPAVGSVSDLATHAPTQPKGSGLVGTPGSLSPVQSQEGETSVSGLLRQSLTHHEVVGQGRGPFDVPPLSTRGAVGEGLLEEVDPSPSEEIVGPCAQGDTIDTTNAPQPQDPVRSEPALTHLVPRQQTKSDSYHDHSIESPAFGGPEPPPDCPLPARTTCYLVTITLQEKRGVNPGEGGGEPELVPSVPWELKPAQPAPCSGRSEEFQGCRVRVQAPPQEPRPITGCPDSWPWEPQLKQDQYPRRAGKAAGSQAAETPGSLDRRPGLILCFFHQHFSEPSIFLYGLECFEGKEIELNGEVRSLQAEGFNNHVLSVRIKGGVWVLCEHSDFRGRQWLVGSTELTNWLTYSGTQRIGSLYPIKQRRVYFCLRNKGLGRWLAVPEDVEDMKAGRVVVSETRAGGSCIWYYEDGLLKNQVAPTMSLQVIGQPSPGSKVVLWSESRQPRQTWSIDTSGHICSEMFEDKILDVKGGRGYDRDHAVLWDRTEERPSQIWDVQVL
ncbi:beta/gamma crystallin domain-containing protein 2 [Trichosurus vulpecula]|uniref:beta/gamma crystallin domain-containing protein 2 n=1 Tax=Trichosurus vulpecula TaxID=9337 RepID=UPI00186B076B|nr:beta/gamma crystallin domain-containing protein 2 [Trichosurus vulpecula]